MAHWDMCSASGPSRTCFLPECFCQLALSDCHFQVSLESRHVLPYCVSPIYVEIVGSAMSNGVQFVSATAPSTPGTPNPDGKSKTTTMPERVSLWLVPTPELDTARYRVGSGVEDHRFCRPCLAPWPLALYQAVLCFFLAGASQYCDSASSYRVPPQPLLKLGPERQRSKSRSVVNLEFSDIPLRYRTRPPGVLFEILCPNTAGGRKVGCAAVSLSRTLRENGSKSSGAWIRTRSDHKLPTSVFTPPTPIYITSCCGQ